jgi:hypothetical protein
MYPTTDTNTVLALARQHQADVKRGFPRRHRKGWQPEPSMPLTFTAPMGRIDVGALSIPAPRQSDREKTVA